MARIQTFMDLYRTSGHETLPVPVPRKTQSSPRSLTVSASSSGTYDAGSSGRRALNWNASRLGPTTLLWNNLEQIRARSRDEVRNNPWAESAASNFEAQLIGNGIRPRWNLPDNPTLKTLIEYEFNRWSKKSDAHGRSDFYGLQAVAAREIFEAGEVFARFYVRPSKWKMRVPLQMQLIESEQLPIFRNVAPTEAGQFTIPTANSIRTGIEFDPDGRRVAYHMYKEHPGETMFYPLEGLTFARVPAEDVLHVYKPVRTGLLRGQPKMTAVLTLLYELEQYSDAELVRKKVAAMFAGFIRKAAPEIELIPLDQDNLQQGQTPDASSVNQDSGTANAKIEAGTLQELYPGEDITFPVMPADQNFEQFIRTALHKFAVGIGATYEQISGDLKGVNYSSIRAGLLNFRRQCEQFQMNVIVFQFCQPTAERFLYEAVMAGVLDLPGYVDDPDQYNDIIWTRPGWDWVDPKNDVDATLTAIRSGLTTRTHEVAERGFDSADVDAEQASDAKRADSYGLIYDSDPRKVLIGRETNPTVDEVGDPKGQEEEKAKEEPSGSDADTAR